MEEQAVWLWLVRILVEKLLYVFGVLRRSMNGRLKLAFGDWSRSVVSGLGIHLGWYR